jgi:thioredoxin reductase (NADPH)
MPTIDTSREPMFPKLSMEEIDRLRRFGTVRRYAAGELLYATADIRHGMLVILSRAVAISGREGLGHVFSIIELVGRRVTCRDRVDKVDGVSRRHRSRADH